METTASGSMPETKRLRAMSQQKVDMGSFDGAGR
jgi:hypothetical protein